MHFTNLGFIFSFGISKGPLSTLSVEITSEAASVCLPPCPRGCWGQWVLNRHAGEAERMETWLPSLPVGSPREGMGRDSGVGRGCPPHSLCRCASAAESTKSLQSGKSLDLLRNVEARSSEALSGCGQSLAAVHPERLSLNQVLKGCIDELDQ